jgi:hypothetical protein
MNLPPTLLQQGVEANNTNGSLLLARVVERSTEWSKSAPTDPPPKETPSLDLHQQKRPNQANAISMGGMPTVYCHTHSIITSLNARLERATEKCGSKGLLSGVACLSRAQVLPALLDRNRPRIC